MRPRLRSDQTPQPEVPFSDRLRDVQRRLAVQTTRSGCHIGDECTLAEANPDVVLIAADEVRLGMLEVVADEVPGMDEALGEPGKVVVNGVTTNFTKDGSAQ